MGHRKICFFSKIIKSCWFILLREGHMKEPSSFQVKMSNLLNQRRVVSGLKVFPSNLILFNFEVRVGMWVLFPAWRLSVSLSSFSVLYHVLIYSVSLNHLVGGRSAILWICLEFFLPPCISGRVVILHTHIFLTQLTNYALVIVILCNSTLFFVI